MFFLGNWENARYEKQKETRAGGMAQAVEQLTSKCDVLSSNSNMAKKKKPQIITIWDSYYQVNNLVYNYGSRT
jgi:hypothetical protein